MRVSPAQFLLLFALVLGAAVGCQAQGEAVAPWKFAVICDARGAATGVEGSVSGVRTSVLRPMAQAMVADGVELVLFPGDLAYGTPSYGDATTQLITWRATMAPLHEAHIPVYAVRGNHELTQGDPGLAAFRAVVEGEHGLTYAVPHKNAMFIGFDEYYGRKATFDSKKYDSALNAGMINPWVIEQIETAPQPWVFTFGHEAAFIEEHEDCLANSPAERDALWDALGARHGVYFCGHDHFYLRAEAPDAKGNPVTELIVGSGGAGFYRREHEDRNREIGRGVMPQMKYFNGEGSDKKYFGYLLVTVNGKTATGEWKAFTNYDYKNWAAPAEPKFEAMDTFTLSVP